METLWKPLFFTGNPRTPDGNPSETLIFYRKPSNSPFAEYNTIPKGEWGTPPLPSPPEGTGQRIPVAVTTVL